MSIVVMRTVIGLIVAVMLIVVVMLKVKVSEVVGLQGNTYEERLVELWMDTLEERRQDQDPWSRLSTSYRMWTTSTRKPGSSNYLKREVLEPLKEDTTL